MWNLSFYSIWSFLLSKWLMFCLTPTHETRSFSFIGEFSFQFSLVFGVHKNVYRHSISKYNSLYAYYIYSVLLYLLYSDYIYPHIPYLSTLLVFYWKQGVTELISYKKSGEFSALSTLMRMVWATNTKMFFCICIVTMFWRFSIVFVHQQRS